ncbi:MAG: molybdopterin-dependent oxidoreductase [Candidatus Thorarchaeota archaeon]
MMPAMFINDKKVEFNKDAQSVLDVARSAGIEIPTLCDHEELEAYGGCRLCLIEVEGWRGYQAACTTSPKEGMIVKTETEELLRMKRNILQLILREHPSACLVCFEWPDCLEYRTESHKAGAVTGCNTCPNRDICELREVVEFLEIKDLEYKPYYKDVPIERSDPFFDRDYNLCVLCGRCVRVCDEVRGTSAITFAQRGHETRVNTAFGTSHIESGCWFCGACIDVCPTGALMPRMTKWIGLADSEEESTCVLCGVGCQTRLDVKWDRIMGTGPGDRKSAPNNGHMCVLGRFCIPSMVNAPDRLKTPHVRKANELIPLSWDDVLAEVARILSVTDPKRVGFLGSPHMSTESAYLFNKLARAAVESPNVDFQGSDFPALIHMELARDQDFNRIQALNELQGADWIISVGGDFVKTHQVVAKVTYESVKKGTPLIVLDEVGRNLRRWATEYAPISPKKLHRLLNDLADRKGKLAGIKANQAKRLLEVTKSGKGAVVVGPRILESPEPRLALRSLVRIAGDDGIILPMFPLGNEAGVIRAGLRPEMLPGPSSVTVKKAAAAVKNAWGKGDFSDGLHLAEMRERAKKGQLDVLYVAEGSISMEGFEKVPSIIYQSPYPSEWIERASIILPSAAFVEEDGTFVNLELRPLTLKQVAKPPGVAREDWRIFADIAKKLGADGFSFANAEEIWDELQHFSRNIEVGGQAQRASWKPATKKKNDWYPRYRGASLPDRIGDLATFIKALPDRDETISIDSFDDLLKQMEEKRASQKQEVSK